MPRIYSELVRLIPLKPFWPCLAVFWGCLSASFADTAGGGGAVQSLAGKWDVRLDPKVLGVGQGWMDPDVKF